MSVAACTHSNEEEEMMTRTRFALVCAVAVLFTAAMHVPAADEQPNPDKNKFIKGRVTNIAAKDNQLTVRTLEGRKMTFQVNASTAIKIDGKKAQLEGLKMKERVLVIYENQNNTNTALAVTEAPVSAEELVKELGQAFQMIKAYAFDKKEELTGLVEGVIDEVNDFISDVGQQVKKEGQAAQKQYEDMKTDLQAKEAKLARPWPRPPRRGRRTGRISRGRCRSRCASSSRPTTGPGSASTRSDGRCRGRVAAVFWPRRPFPKTRSCVRKQESYHAADQ